MKILIRGMICIRVFGRFSQRLKLSTDQGPLAIDLAPGLGFMTYYLDL